MGPLEGTDESLKSGNCSADKSLILRDKYNRFLKKNAKEDKKEIVKSERRKNTSEIGLDSEI